MCKRKIIEFINSLADGGAETLVKDYATMIDSSRFEVVVLTLSNDNSSATSRILGEHHVKVITVYKKWNALIRVAHRLFGRIWVGRSLKKVVKTEKPAVIHAHLQTLIYLADSIQYLKNVSLLYTCHNLPAHIFGDEKCNRFRATKKLIGRSGLQLVALHEDMATEMNRMFNVNNTAVIRNGIDYNRFMNVSRSKNEIRKDLGIDSDAIVIGNVGRFTPQKNHEAILSIFKEYHEKKEKAFLLLVGQGELKDCIEKKIQSMNLGKNVLILSNRGDIPEINKAMDVFLFPSKWEGFGIALIEAQIAGIPCVASDVVPQATKISNRVVYESLDASTSQWCEDIDLVLERKVDADTIDYEYDMSREIRKLEKLYER